MKTLKDIKLGEKKYSFIEYEDGATSVEGYKFKVTNVARDHFGNLGGFMRDMFAPIKDLVVEEVIVMFIDVPTRGHLTGVYFRTNDCSEVDYNLTSSGRFIEVVKRNLDKGNIQYETINTLEEIYNNPEYEMNMFLDNYVNPKSAYDTGFYIGDKMVNFGENLESKDNVSAKMIVNELIEADSSGENNIYEDIEISKVKFIINKPSPMGADVELTFHDSEGDVYSIYHKLAAKDLGRFPTQKEHIEYIENERLEILHDYAYSLNDKLNRMARRGEVSKERRDKLIQETVSNYERDIDNDENTEMRLYISYQFMLNLMSNGLIKLSE